ncbi:MAG: hypothetical protein J6V28_04835 [Tidjanibacter sp.]|nr:hypothetical protein [Tidjanibacter sp.]
MKKFLLSLVAAAAALFATSCVNELEDGIKDNTGNGVTFEISASELASRALGDAEQAVYLLYGVYEIDGSSVEFQNRLSNTTINDNLKFVDGNATVTINLLDDTSYNVLFWAVSAGTYADGITTTPAFTINWAEQTMRMNDSLEANVEGYDAFYGYSEGVAAGSNPEPVQLSRPFAQLNIGTNDLSIAAAGGFNPANSKVVLENAPKKFDLKNGSVTETGTITYGLASMNEVKNSRYPIDGYNYLSMNYVLVSGKALVNVTLEVNDGNNKTIDNTYNSVPVQRNYRTNVYGSLLTNGSQFNVTIDKGLSTEYEENHTIVKTGYQFVLALLRGENVILANNITVTAQDITDAKAALNGSIPVMSRTTASGAINVVINLGGHIITFENGVALDLKGGSVTLEGEGKIVAEQGSVSGSDSDYGFTNGGVFTAEGSEVNTTGYKEGTALPTVSEGLAAVFANGGTFTMTTDIALTEALTVSANAILDLNGHVLSGVNNTGSGHLIKVNNSKSLTVKDSSAAKNGKITYAQGTSNVGWTIYVEGVLNLESGAIELTGDEWSIGYAVDLRPNAWGTAYTEPSTFNMTGGKLISSDGAVRVASSSSDSYKQVSANFNMTAGEIEAAYDGIFVQQSNEAYDVLNVNISGGTLKSEFYPIRLYGPVATSKIGNSSVTISGGSFSKVNLTDKVALVEGLIYLGGSVNAETLYHTNVAITGGTFTNGEALPTYKTPVAKIGDEKFGTLQEAIEAAEDGAEIVLISDIHVGETLNLAAGKHLTLNLDGYTISGAFTKGDDAANAMIKNNATLTIIGGTIKNVTENGDAVISNKGTLTLDDVKIVGAPLSENGYPEYNIYSIGGSLVVEEGTEIVADRGAIRLQDGADVTINGGDIKVTDALGTRALTAHVIYAKGSASKLTINNGNFAMKYNAAAGLGASIICPAGATIKVYGGNFNFAGQKGGQSGCFQNYMGYGAPVDVYGGTYNDNTVTKNLAAGYTAVESNGKWTVVKAE